MVCSRALIFYSITRVALDRSYLLLLLLLVTLLLKGGFCVFFSLLIQNSIKTDSHLSVTFLSLQNPRVIQCWLKKVVRGTILTHLYVYKCSVYLVF